MAATSPPNEPNWVPTRKRLAHHCGSIRASYAERGRSPQFAELLCGHEPAGESRHPNSHCPSARRELLARLIVDSAHRTSSTHSSRPCATLKAQHVHHDPKLEDCNRNPPDCLTPP